MRRLPSYNYCSWGYARGPPQDACLSHGEERAEVDVQRIVEPATETIDGREREPTEKVMYSTGVRKKAKKSPGLASSRTPPLSKIALSTVLLGIPPSESSTCKKS